MYNVNDKYNINRNEIGKSSSVISNSFQKEKKQIRILQY